MPRRTPPPSAAGTWTASQVVAHNMTRARELRGLTQAEIADRLTEFTGGRWSQATVAQAEGSVTGTRVRQFTANELVALARTFDLPVLWFFLPPDPDDNTGTAERLETPDHPTGLPWEYLLLLTWGHADNFGLLSDRAGHWTHATPFVTMPAEDMLDEINDLAGTREKQRYTPNDILAAAFAGLARRNIRGAPQPGQELTDLANHLRNLADALTAFNNYKPGTYLDREDIEGFAEQRRRPG